MLGLGALAVSLEGASAPTTLRSEAIALSPSTIEALDELTVSYQRLYHSAAPADLLTPVRAHLQTTTELLRTSPARELRMRLLRNRSQVATLAGRLSFFDLQDALGARSYYNIALEAAREAGDDRLASNSLGHISFVPASEGSFAAAGDYLHGARQHACRAGDLLMTSWLAAVESKLHTNGGEPARALAALDQAESA